MNTEQFHIWTSADLIDTLKRTFQAHNKDDEAHSDALWVDDRYRFYRSEFADGVPAAGFSVFDSLPGGGQAARIYLDDRYSALKPLAQRGWRTLWYNPGNAIAPDLVPVQDGELYTLEGLDQVPALLAKPSLSTCYDWLDAWNVPENIRRHSRLVAWMAYALGVMLRGHGIQLDPILAHRGGLLHDLDKLHTLDHAQPHGEMGAAYLSHQGHPDLALIVSGHVMRTALQVDHASPSWERRLVFFCDKLAEEDRIVPFDVRLRALKERYPGFIGVMDRAAPYVWGLSDEICSILSIPSHENLINKLSELQNS
jgi:hypothetical protein